MPPCTGCHDIVLWHQNGDDYVEKVSIPFQKGGKIKFAHTQGVAVTQLNHVTPMGFVSHMDESCDLSGLDTLKRRAHTKDDVMTCDTSGKGGVATLTNGYHDNTSTTFQKKLVGVGLCSNDRHQTVAGGKTGQEQANKNAKTSVSLWERTRHEQPCPLHWLAGQAWTMDQRALAHEDGIEGSKSRE